MQMVPVMEMEVRTGSKPACRLVDVSLTKSAPIPYFIEHQKKFRLRKNLKDLSN